ncbi:hypothetical protein ACFYZB_04205 [Streptomyces sp. NPDC001852]|uniref:hypothetical protein n=1 Tax=Streptomyces sp. NPDC001852 TaxID=3364619 RepID=UPI00368FB806
MSVPPPSPAAPPKKRNLAKGCGIFAAAAVGLFVLSAVVAGIASGGKDGTAKNDAKASASSSPKSSPSKRQGSKPFAAAPSHKPSPARQQSHTAVNGLEHGAQQGLGNCVIDYKDAQMGQGTSTFSAVVLNDSGQPYAPADSDPYSVNYEMTVTGTDGTKYAVDEVLGSGSRTAADNPGGSDWFTVNQGQVQVSANSTEGMVDSTVPVSLAQVKGVRGDIVVTNQNDNNYLKQEDCAVRPAQG